MEKILLIYISLFLLTVLKYYVVKEYFFYPKQFFLDQTISVNIVFIIVLQLCMLYIYIYYLFKIYIFFLNVQKNYHKILLLTIKNFPSISLKSWCITSTTFKSLFMFSLPFFFICHFNTTLFKSQFLEIRGCRQTWIYVRMGKKTGTAFSTSCGQRSPWTTKDCGNWKEIQCYWRFYFFYKNTYFYIFQLL